jgi:serine/threonine protein kinase
MIGTTLAHYEILASIGRGGMGEVWKARDTKLGRDVAIKALPAEFATDLERIARLEREAKMLASLNHPNIAAIYGLEQVDATRFLVLELIDGDTLADIAARGPLPDEEALRLSRQIADALEAAHEKGVVHRDLKPANVKVTLDGKVKVLDFGLAKALAADDSRIDLSQSPTMSLGATRQGVVLGTAAYMAPEQARGRVVDRRADIWAFGCVMYELLAGSPPFKGEDVSEILAAVLKEQPDWNRVPARTRRLLKKCLEKDPQRRLRDIADAWALLDESETRDQRSFDSARGWLWPSLAAAFALTTAIALWAPWRVEPNRPLVRLEVDLGPDVSLRPDARSLAISPDGSRIAFVSQVANGSYRLFTRRLDQSAATELPGTDNAQYPFFSPDGRWLGYVALGRIHKISVDGGAAVPVSDFAGFVLGADWAEDDTIMSGGAFGAGLRRMSSTGGKWTTLTDVGKTPSASEAAHAFPHVLPGGKAAIFSAYGQSADVDQATIDVVSFSDRARKTLVRGGVSALYSPSGHLIYVNKNTLFAVGFDLQRLETRGAAVAVVSDVQFSRTQARGADLTISRNGTLVYRAGGASAASDMATLQWIDASGSRSPLTSKPGVYQALRLSPNGKQVALVVSEGASNLTTDLWVFEVGQSRMNKRSFTGRAFSPVWSPDNRFIVFSERQGIWWTRADGASEPQILIRSDAIKVPYSFVGKQLAFIEVNQSGPAIFTVAVEEVGGQLKAGAPTPLAESRPGFTHPQLSPDGRWVAYSSNDAGSSEVYVRPFAPPASGQSGRTLVSSGLTPHWAPNRPELLYASGGRLMAVSYASKEDAFVVVGEPRVRVEKLGSNFWDVAPDGRIVAVTPVETPGPQARDHTVVFLQNFFDHLRRLVPVE